MGGEVGAAGRGRLRAGDPCGARCGRELDRHRALLRLGPRRGGRRARRAGARRRPGLHEVRHDAPRRRRRLHGLEPGRDPRRRRREPAPARRRVPRPAATPRPRPVRADRGDVGRRARARRRRQGAPRRDLEPSRRGGRARARRGGATGTGRARGYSIGRLTDVLICADSIRSPELRHEVPVPVPDAFLYIERNGRRVVVVSAFEQERVAAADPSIEIRPPENFGIDELLAADVSEAEAYLTVYGRACEDIGVADAVVPANFPLELADHLRANGIEISVDRELFEDRRRRKNATEVAGLRRAQRACEAALDVAREMLRNAIAGETLVLDGAPLTSERLMVAIQNVFSEHGVFADEVIASHGAQTAIGHESGHGALLPDEPIVFDLFPRDRETGVYSDMTRTYVVGTPSDEIVEYHSLCQEALDLSAAAAEPR